MKFHCPGCQSTFAVADEKIPEGKAVKILCPKCRIPVERADLPKPVAPPAAVAPLPPTPPPGEDFEIGPPGDEPVSQGMDSSVRGATQRSSGDDSPSASGSPFSMPGEEPEGEEGFSPVEVVEEGVRTCLLCCSEDSRREFMARVLHELDFFVSPVMKVAHALSKLQHNRYDLVILDEGFDGGDGTENLLLRHIQLLPMHMRRQFFLCLVSEGLPSLDQFLGFRIGVDMTVNVKELDKIKIMLVRAMKDHGAFYKVYLEELGRKGQV